MKKIETDITGVFLLEPVVYRDERGYFLETFRKSHFQKFGMTGEFLQDNSSRSQKGTLRGLHYQLPPAAQAKLMMVSLGTILDVAVDLRKDSPTFGRHVAVELSEENHRQLYIPEGFAHGFSVLSDHAVIHYKCSGYYSSDLERGIRWNDPEIDIDWRVDDPILSEKDNKLPFLDDIQPDELF